MSKRAAPFGSTNEPSAKRSTTSASLNSFFPTTHRPAPPSPLVHSDPITDRSSTFIAHAAPVTSSNAAEALQTHVRNLRTTSHPVECSHEVLAYRIVAPKVGKSGLESEEDWTVREAGDDDGEKGAWAVVKECLKQEGAVDVGVVVSRLYGGVMLGPVRFTHIRQVATQAIQRLAAAQALPSLLSRLKELDAEISTLSLATSAVPDPAKLKQQYASLDVPKAERLVAAREKRVEVLRRQKEKREEEERREMEELQRRAEREREEEEARAEEEARREVEAALGADGEDEEGVEDEDAEAEAAAREAEAQEQGEGEELGR
ncbi:hypothetical protein JCM8097_000462 [Rhodosporidiobolus ruineniae]